MIVSAFERVRLHDNVSVKYRYEVTDDGHLFICVRENGGPWYRRPVRQLWDRTASGWMRERILQAVEENVRAVGYRPVEVHP